MRKNLSNAETETTTTGSMTTADQKEIDRTMAFAVAELRRHGGTEQEVAELLRQFKIITDANEKPSETAMIPE